MLANGGRLRDVTEGIMPRELFRRSVLVLGVAKVWLVHGLQLAYVA